MTIGGSTITAELAALEQWPSPAPSIGKEERNARLEHARTRLAAIGADALLVNAGPSLRYFTGIGWSPTERLVAMLLPVSGKPWIICPAFERGSLEAELAIDAELLLWEEDESPLALIADNLAANAVLALDPLLPFHWSEPLRASFRPVSGALVIDGLRMVKSATELALMQQAKANDARGPSPRRAHPRAGHPREHGQAVHRRCASRAGRCRLHLLRGAVRASRPPIRTGCPATSNSRKANWC